jgi:hypothetical protein
MIITKWMAFVLGAVVLASCAQPSEELTEETTKETTVERTVERTWELKGGVVVRAVYPKADGPWIWTEGEEPRRLTESVNAFDVRLSGDGNTAAFQGGTDWELYAASITEGKAEVLLDRADLDALTPEGGGFVTIDQFDFGARSHAVYFTTKVPNPQGPQYDLYRVAAGDADPVRIFAPGEGGPFTFSPDGEWLTVYHPDELVLARPDGTDARAMHAFSGDSPMGSAGPQIVWARDSSGFSFLSLAGTGQGMQTISVRYVPVEGEPEERMTFQGYPGARLAPDGKTIVYLAKNNGSTDVHLVDSQGKDTLYASLEEDAFFMDWAPGGYRFLVATVQEQPDSPDTAYMPYICAPGADPVRLTGRSSAYPAYWAGGGRVLFYADGLRLWKPNEEELLIDDGLSANAFDFTLLYPV